MCGLASFSLEHLLIWLVVAALVVALVKLVLPRIFPEVSAWLATFSTALRYVAIAVVLCFLIVIFFDLWRCAPLFG